MIQKKNARLFIAIEIPAEVQEKLYAGLWTSEPAKQNKIRLTQQRNLCVFWEMSRLAKLTHLS